MIKINNLSKRYNINPGSGIANYGGDLPILSLNTVLFMLVLSAIGFGITSSILKNQTDI